MTEKCCFLIIKIFPTIEIKNYKAAMFRFCIHMAIKKYQIQALEFSNYENKLWSSAAMIQIQIPLITMFMTIIRYLTSAVLRFLILNCGKEYYRLHTCHDNVCEILNPVQMSSQCAVNTDPFIISNSFCSVLL